MKTPIYIVTFLILLAGPAKGQTVSELDNLLSKLNGVSTTIAASPHGKRVFQYGHRALPLLSEVFADTTRTEVYSDCLHRYLTKGDLAIILADRIEMMPYFQLTGIQNCTFEFCPGNGNLIEYYLDTIARDGYQRFKVNYRAWLRSKDRKKWSKSIKPRTA